MNSQRASSTPAGTPQLGVSGSPNPRWDLVPQPEKARIPPHKSQAPAPLPRDQTTRLRSPAASLASGLSRLGTTWLPGELGPSTNSYEFLGCEFDST